MRKRLAAAHYELIDRRPGYTWTRKREAIREAKKNGAAGVYRVTYPRVGSETTGTARTIIWRGEGRAAQIEAGDDL